MNKDIEHI